MNLSDATVMLVDKDALTHGFTRLTLKRLGFTQVHHYYDGNAAIDAIGKLRPDLVLSDIEISIRDGGTFINAIRQHHDLLVQETTVIGLSDRALKGAPAPGMSICVTKPPLISDLRHQITQLLQKRQAH